jgi:P27 family predicted phage terminase small subunit
MVGMSEAAEHPKPNLHVAKPKAKPKAPAHLRAGTRRWWRQVVEDYDLEPHHLLLLQTACSAWDRAEQAREAVKRDGAYLPDRYGGRKAHPGLNVERDNRVLFARALRELDLDGEPAPDPRLPR